MNPKVLQVYVARRSHFEVRVCEEILAKRGFGPFGELKSETFVDPEGENICTRSFH